MATESRIEWTEQTWNPVTGCTKVSPGCKFCYAEVMAKRLTAMGTIGYENGFQLTLHPERLSQPLKRAKSTVYFVNSMSDLFHPEVPDLFIESVVDVINKTPHHTYQVLTKRAERLTEFFSNRLVPNNMWLGVSVEDKQYGLPRIDYLRKVKAKTRFLSIEPLLEDIGNFNLNGMHWVIVGGESGHGARAMEESWAISVKNQCIKANVPFFFKQWGAWSREGVRASKKVNGRELDGKLWDDYPSAVAV